MSYSKFIQQNIDYTLKETNLTSPEFLTKRVGKVRDSYFGDNNVMLVTTDRISAFNRVLSCIPFKGQVLNGIANFWFNKTAHIIANHVIATPDPNVTIAKRIDIFPVEIIVRAYLTGSTDTSIWVNYNNGARNYCGNLLEEGMLKNQKLPEIIVTPTTKSDEHDSLISSDEIVNKRLMTQEEWNYVSSKAIEIFEFASNYVATKGLILVDTKMEFGLDSDGNIVLADEVLTPDSSRYWIAKSYESRLKAGLDPESLDKEFLRLWFVDNCDPYNDKILPDAPQELVAKLSQKYIELYELLTESEFQFPDTSVNISSRIKTNLDI
jgi:phosphoribosylaminoimidazole-succinocarboxamide synthase